MDSILRYLKNGTLFTGVCVRLLLGGGGTAHRLTSFSMQLKLMERLTKQYMPILEAYDRNHDISALPQERSRKVWVCWFQGMENAPELVQTCYRSLREHITDREIILITAENMGEYVQFPDYILEKWKKREICHAHMSDLLRLELLIRYGGTWVDSSILWTGDAAGREFLFDSDLFFFQMLPPGRGGHTHIISNWFLTACANNPILMATRHLLYEYWKTHKEAVDYFLFHDFMIMALRYYPKLWDDVPPLEGAFPGMLQRNFFKPYNEERWRYIRSMTPLHKLTYRVDPEKAAMEGTYYRAVLFPPD